MIEGTAPSILSHPRHASAHPAERSQGQATTTTAWPGRVTAPNNPDKAKKEVELASLGE